MTSDDRTALRHSVPSSASTSPLLGRKQSRRRAHTLGGLLWFGRPRRQLQALLTSLPALAVVSVLITAVLVVVLRLRRKGEDMHAATDQAGVSDSVPAAYVAADLPSKHVSPSMELNSPVWNAFLRLGSASSDTINLQPRTTTFNAPDLDMARLHKQRLKPWSDFRVLGGAQCPAVNNECPHFTACRGNYNAGVETRPSKNSLSAVHFCTLGNVYDERHVEPIRAPRDVRGRMVSALVYSQSTLPW